MSTPTKRAGLEQGRAAYAWRCVEAGNDHTKSKEYKSYVKKMPMLIKTNGLGAAVAFALAKGSGKDGGADIKHPWGLIYHQIEVWLRDEAPFKLEELGQRTLAYALTEVESASYRAVTVESLALLAWMKRFADALIEGEAQD